MLKPVILITLYRRYFTFLQALKNIQKYKNEFKIEPDVIVVYAQPEKHMKFLVEQPIVNKVIYRPKLVHEGEKGGTTYPESHNIRIGLEYIRDNYKNCYAVVQAGDILVKESCYAHIDHIINHNSKDAAVCHWPNSIVPVGCYHTNIFAVTMDEKHWPPVCSFDEYDVLEWAWGKKLGNYLDRQQYNFLTFNNQLFDHVHTDGPYPKQEINNININCYGYGRYNQGLLLQITGRKLSKKEILWQKLHTLSLKGILVNVWRLCLSFLVEEK